MKCTDTNLSKGEVVVKLMKLKCDVFSIILTGARVQEELDTAEQPFPCRDSVNPFEKSPFLA